MTEIFWQKLLTLLLTINPHIRILYHVFIMIEEFSVGAMCASCISIIILKACLAWLCSRTSGWSNSALEFSWCLATKLQLAPEMRCFRVERPSCLWFDREFVYCG
jgi:hypothetical protein